MKRIRLTLIERLNTPCLFAPHWSVAYCDHAICGNWITRRMHEERKAKRSADAV